MLTAIHVHYQHPVLYLAWEHHIGFDVIQSVADSFEYEISRELNETYALQTRGSEDKDRPVIAVSAVGVEPTRVEDRVEENIRV